MSFIFRMRLFFDFSSYVFFMIQNVKRNKIKLTMNDMIATFVNQDKRIIDQENFSAIRYTKNNERSNENINEKSNKSINKKNHDRNCDKCDSKYHDDEHCKYQYFEFRKSE